MYVPLRTLVMPSSVFQFMFVANFHKFLDGPNRTTYIALSGLNGQVRSHKLQACDAPPLLIFWVS